LAGELVALILDFQVGEGDVADHGVELGEFGIAEVLDPDVGLGWSVRAMRPEMESNSTPMNRCPPGAVSMKLPTPRPGSSIRPLSGTPKRERASCMDCMTMGDVKNWE
jgi:hypothetical protein